MRYKLVLWAIQNPQQLTAALYYTITFGSTWKKV
jgi:hypothetical protein